MKKYFRSSSSHEEEWVKLQITYFCAGNLTLNFPNLSIVPLHYCHKLSGTEHFGFQVWKFGKFQKLGQFTLSGTSTQPISTIALGSPLGPHCWLSVRPGSWVLYISSISNCQTHTFLTDLASHLSLLFRLEISPRSFQTFHFLKL